MSLFVTLTTSTRTAQTPAEAFTRANDALPLLFKRWRRKFPGARFEYFLVWERTKAGWPHAHILLSAERPSKHWLSAEWKALTGSYIVDIQPLAAAERAASYLAKYLTKDPAVPQGHRRWRRSAHFFQTKLEPPPFKRQVVTGWTKQPRPTAAQALVWLRQGLALDLQDPDMPRCLSSPALWASQISAGLYEKLVKKVPAWALPSDDDSLYA